MVRRLRLTRLLPLIVVSALWFSVEVLSAPGADPSAARPDLVMIGAIAEQGPTEFPAVQFLHDRHTEALESQGKDCLACHKKDEQGRMVFRYQRLADLDAGGLKKIYHDGCIGCHSDTAKAGGKAFGPRAGECRRCHVDSPAYSLEHVEAGMDNALHHRHWGSKAIRLDQGQETNCGACHHEYDKTTEKLVYVKYKEENCVACHTDSPKDEVKTGRVDAFHGDCLSCHLKLGESTAEKFGPTKCAGCHGSEKSLEIAAANKAHVANLGGTLPRLPRKQPDAALLAVLPDPGTEARPSTMPVAFNHKLHEVQTNSCADCHHQAMKPCGECHSLSGKAEGGAVPLEEAMHTESSARSCTGCHAQQQKGPACAGCHSGMPGGSMPVSGCADCHLDSRSLAREARAAGSGTTLFSSAMEGLQESLGLAPEAAGFEIPVEKEARERLASALISKRPSSPAMARVEDIPDIVKIGALADEYLPSEMPHRKIVLKLAEGMKDSPLAAAFHDQPMSMCQGCHHQSPVSAEPPACKSCHAAPFQENRLGRPGLKAAYHDLCMDCHKGMALEKPANTDCIGCHRKKENG